MENIKICIFADERVIHTRRWVKGLRSIGLDVDLITLIKERDNDIGAISLGSESKASYITKIGKLRSIVNELKPDIFHSHHASSFGFLASFVKHPRKILSVWGYDVIAFPYNNRLNRMMIKRALNRAYYITATSRFLKDAVLKLEKNISNIEIIPFGVDLDQFKFISRKPADEVVIGIAKALRPKYGIDFLIHAFNKLQSKYSNIKLKIAGKGKYEHAYKKLVRDLALSHSIEFTGFINHDELPTFLNNIDIFAMPSISDDESFGVAAIEASATGLPVVASGVGGVPEVIDNNTTGFLIERKNIDSLADALERLIKDPQLRFNMGKAGRKFVEENYVWNDNLRSMKVLYEKILAT